MFSNLNPPASKASREVANLPERKNPHTPLFDPSSNQNQKPFEKKFATLTPVNEMS